jgi:hypothetical protein
MRYGRFFATVACVAALGSCATDTPPDPAQFVSATTLSEAIDRASVAYGVPKDLLTAIAWSETRFSAPEKRSDDHEHHNGDVGPLGLRNASDRGATDTLSLAMHAMQQTDREALAHNPGLSVAGAASVLAQLGRTTHADPDDLSSWAEALARFSGLGARSQQVSYVSQIFGFLRDGVATEPTFSGERLGIAAHPTLDFAETLLGVHQTVQASGDYGPALWAPAANGNFTNGREGSPIRFVVIHTMQGSYAGSISWFRNPSSRVSAHYSVRSSDGEISQSVSNSDTAWHAGNWFYNTHSIGIEHEGYVGDPGRWYTEAMYQSSARLVRALCDRYSIPIDRAHIIGHYQIPDGGSGAACSPSATNCGGSGGHTDPGNGGAGWNWNRFMDLVRGGSAPPPPPPPPAPAYAAELVGVNCPATATAGERPVAYVEYRNTGTATWQTASTRIGTTNPRDHRGVFYDTTNWVAPNRPSGVDRATAPGAVGRFSFVLNVPDVATDMVVRENYGLVQEGVTWFGPGDMAVSCSVSVTARSTARPPPPLPDAGQTPDVVVAGDAAVVDDVVVTEDVQEMPDVVSPEDVPAPKMDVATSVADAETDPDLRVAPTQEPGCGCHVQGPSNHTKNTIFSMFFAIVVVCFGRRRSRR